MHKPTLSAISRRAACRRMLGMAGAAPLALSWMGAMKPVLADSWTWVNRVEEDWYIKIGTPEPGEDSPQITTVMAPSWSLSGAYGIFDMNCATQPGFASGGVQLQMWYDGAITETCSNADWTSLSVVNEEITYTSAMSLADGLITYEIINGTSATWGAFGTGELQLKLSRATNRRHLMGYSPEFSAYNSRIGFASHRVRDFILQRVRYYDGSDLLFTDNDPRVLHHYEPTA